MNKINIFLISVIMILTSAISAPAADVTITTGAGYKTMVEELSAAYKEQGGSITEMYGGHIGQMLTQISHGSGVTIIISDKGTLDTTSHSVEFDSFEVLGGTPLVLAWRKGVTMRKPEDLMSSQIESVCYPDGTAAIYGRAAVKFLESSGIGEKIKAKTAEVSSVPQVMAYLVSDEMDAGFVNRVMVINSGKKIGGWIEIIDGYPPLDMVAAVVKGYGNDAGTKNFLDFLRGEKGMAILKKNGIWK